MHGKILYIIELKCEFLFHQKAGDFFITSVCFVLILMIRVTLFIKVRKKKKGGDSPFWYPLCKESK